MYNDNVTWDWCWQCNSYHRTEAGQPRNTRCSIPRLDTTSREVKEQPSNRNNGLDKKP